MTASAQKETLGFQAEIKQLLNIVINSLYSNREIFLRELLSNASDASDKLRFLAISDEALYEGNSNLEVKIAVDKTARTITISDNGIGMSRADVIDQLGTIAKSGTREFIEKFTGDQSKDAKLIGQFGVGFYSAFIVADKVVVETRRAGLTHENGVRWESTGIGSYTVENIEKRDRGTVITLHLKEGEDEYLDAWRLRTIIKKYSDHLPLPILMKKEADPTDENKQVSEEYETVNSATALWTLPKDKIKDEEYNELYKQIAHDFENPLLWSHNKVEGNLQYTLLLYIPARAPFDLFNRERPHGLKLYVQRVFIMDNAEVFLPYYLRFVRGIVDSNDLPLNISREVLQHNTVVDKIRGAVSKRVLGMLEKLAQDEPEKYSKLWNEFGQVLKEGPAEDHANKEQIAKLLRFASTYHESDSQNVSLDDYISRMIPDQDKIFYITADSYNAAKDSPHLEVFRAKGIEVLLLTDRIDEWLVANLAEFGGKQLQSVAKGHLDLEKFEDKEKQEEFKKQEEEFTDFTKRVKEVLGDAVKQVDITHRLTESPSCLVVGEHELGGHMQRILKAAGQAMPESKPTLELNPNHPIVVALKNDGDSQRFNEVCHLLFDQAMLAEGGQLENPALFIKRLNKYLAQTMGA